MQSHTSILCKCQFLAYKICVSAKSDYISAFETAFLHAFLQNCFSANLQTDLLFYKSAIQQIWLPVCFSANLLFCKSGNLLCYKFANLQFCFSANLIFCKAVFRQTSKSAFLHISLSACFSTFLEMQFCLNQGFRKTF